MTVYRPTGRKTYRYDFEYEGTRHHGNTKQTNQQDAELFESAMKLRLRREGGNIGTRPESPHFAIWAPIYQAYVVRTEKPKRPDSIEDEVRVVLRFWGAKPAATTGKNKAIDGEPYHDLRLRDAIDDPSWIVKFEQWMDARGCAGGTKNHYRSRLSKMYKVAMTPQYRKTTGITVNPFLGIPRDPGGNRTVTLTPKQVASWMAAMSYHTALAVAIAALAPMLRLENILTLRWDEHIDPKFRFITVAQHKTQAHTGAPLVTPISAQLRGILQNAKKKRTSDYVISYRGEPVKSIRDGLIAAAERAGITYGRFVDDGATFHTLRHTAATLIANAGVNAQQHKSTMGWSSATMADKYTHLQPTHLKPVVEALSRVLPLATTLAGVRRRAVGKVAGPSSPTPVKSLANRRKSG